MLASSLPTSLRTPLCRQISSTASRKVKNGKKPQLPPKKMRALVSLYHEAGEFITPQNLSSKVDYAFHEQRNIFLSSTDKREKTLRDLHKEVETRKSLPKLSSGVMEPSVDDYYSYDNGTNSVDWSSKDTERRARLKAALYGTGPPSEVPSPGYEVLVEEHERIQKLLKDE
ncbi:hypothetical protein BDY19DRAFT_926404 [Irpex rosettiformis]|uniref:Uncharacterized protein n=1 Tax=Irpex rosettiformis TaxID=378272 RepID=A0ACB8UEW0_9APHY|nr:hypothetical protein BDY19DRAFT_926404 [Irpex rosettiformis]